MTAPLASQYSSSASASPPNDTMLPPSLEGPRASLSGAPTGAPVHLFSASAVRIRKLPLNTTEDTLRSMVVWSKDVTSAEVLPADQSEDAGFRAAILHFRSQTAALEAKRLLDGKPNIANDAHMLVDLVSASPGGRRYTVDLTANANATATLSTSTSSSASSAGPTPRHSARFNRSFPAAPGTTNARVSPPATNGTANPKELPTPENSTHYQNIFSPQSPIGNHLNDRGRISGKSLINNDSVEDDETGELLKDPVAYAEHGAALQARRPTTLPGARMTGLSLNTTAAHAPGALASLAPASAMLPPMPQNTAVSPGMPGALSYPLGHQHYQRHTFPPVNPADQNPPCNTLYVGNLPIDTSEDELKAMFSKQRGYKRLCFRTKQNGPMCFVEFEDVSFATKALHELYGHPLHNSVKGGIRLSFSKNPLGVRSGQSMVSGPPGVTGLMQGLNGLMLAPASNFGTASGPPPGLAPPGLAPNRMAYAGNMMSMNGATQYVAHNAYPPATSWTSHQFSSNPAPNGNNGFGPPAYMMGR